MSSKRVDQRTERTELVRESYARLQSWRAVAKELNLPRSTVRHHQKFIDAAPLPLAQGDTRGLKTAKRSLPRGGHVKRYILTSAQNNTYAHEAAWANLVALAEYYGAEITISRFAYNKAGHKDDAA